MKDLILLCATMFFFTLFYYMIKKLDIFLKNNQELSVECQKHTLLQIISENSEDCEEMEKRLEEILQQNPSGEIVVFYKVSVEKEKNIEAERLSSFHGCIRKDELQDTDICTYPVYSIYLNHQK